MVYGKERVGEQSLEQWFAPLTGALTAFSGGIDSTLVLFLSRRYLGRQKAIGVISKSESLKDSDYRLAVKFCTENDIRLETVYTKELSDPRYNTNPANRCFHCKTHLYRTLEIMRIQFPGYTLLNGTNMDDFSDYRPGLQAAKNHGVRSPLAELGIDKTQIRVLAKKYDIPLWDKPASPCLSSRIPYGSRVTAKKLDQIQKMEELLVHHGFPESRARHHGTMCVLEVPREQIGRLQKLIPILALETRALGFIGISVDPEGLVSGKLNRILHAHGPFQH